MLLISLFKKHNKAMISGLIITFLVMLTQYFGAENSVILQRINGLIYDLRLNITIESRNIETNIIILDIDEKSLEKEGRFPWSRVKIAKIIEKLADAGTAVVAFDIMFSEPERNYVNSVIKLLDKKPDHKTLINQLSPLIQSADADAIMAQSLTLTDVVLGMAFHTDPQVQVGEMQSSVITFDTQDLNQLHSHEFFGHTNNITILQNNSPGIGFINSTPDLDNFIRTTSLIAQYKDRFYPSLALEAAKLYTLSDDIKVITADLTTSRSIVGLKLGREIIPTDEYGRVLIPFKGPAKSYPYISATDLLHDQVDSSLFDSAIVFVGTSAIGHSDLRATPVGVQYPGVEIHANVIDGILHPEILPSVPDWWEATILLMLLLIGCALSFYFPFLGPRSIAFTGFFILLGLISLDFYLWSVQKVSLPMATCLLISFSLTILNIGIGYFTESGRRKQIKGIFDQYVPPAHIDKMLEDPNAINLSGQRKEMTVLFSDIRSFTTISENLTANELVNLLNRYFSPITQSIFEHRGTIDKYVGDMVMAFWNAPVSDKHHVSNAICCAFKMLEITNELSDIFEKEGLPQIKVGVGINTGEMNVGDMGSTYRKAYTVLGDAVNLGSRLEGLTKFYGVDILVGETCIEHCPDMKFRLIDKVRVKGKHKAVSIFEPIPENMTEDLAVNHELKQYQEAYNLYLDQNWEKAKSHFLVLTEVNKNRKIYTIYLERIASLKDTLLSNDWDGSFTHTSK
ncbi:adenylate/guanylate cyclase domain-containing protein [Pseudoalteromonas sp. NBT06-2]|uniref:CHASE2 domain-containing protein n=1 Tax=Pseudoalteromonas sp. NBT06-2 TaxID=2025950 RepID=UPI000BA6A48B|nr:adenylate/guanylate cyclase domain-containing protein [Pseudoalteromonas sp. NBT06-2]PAJ73557.1 adenylate/guanylate cyclase domain-containing protein [Pseudoalteromonas sp. NBT06-2]